MIRDTSEYGLMLHSSTPCALSGPDTALHRVPTARESGNCDKQGLKPLPIFCQSLRDEIRHMTSRLVAIRTATAAIVAMFALTLTAAENPSVAKIQRSLSPAPGAL